MGPVFRMLNIQMLKVVNMHNSILHICDVLNVRLF